MGANKDVCRQNAIRVLSYAKDFEPGRWSLLGLGDEEKWYGSLIDKPLEDVELYSENYDTRIRQERTSSIQVLISTFTRLAHKKGRWDGRYSIHFFVKPSCQSISSISTEQS